MKFFKSPTGLLLLGGLSVVLASGPGYYLTHAGATPFAVLMAALASLGSYIGGVVITKLGGSPPQAS